MARNKDIDESAKGGLPLIRLLPNMVTLIGLCLGLFALKYAMSGQWQMAVGLIVIAAFVDGIDGRLARMLNASSDFGAQLDSFTDFVNFGVAPALTIYLWKSHEIKGFGWAVALFFIICMALRLARFNVGLSDEDQNPEMRDKFFQGMPAPCGGLMSLMPMILSFLFEDKLGYSPFNITTPMIIVYTILIAVFLVSSIPTISVKKIKIPREFASLFMALSALFILSLIIEPWVTLPILAVLYVCTFPVSIIQYYQIKSKK